MFGIFAGFWLSYAALVLGLVHNWYAIPLRGLVHTQALFLITWLVIIGLLTLVTLRLPVAYTLLFGLIDAALVVLLIATVQLNADLTKAGGWIVLAFAAVGAYLFVDIADQATGGKGVPLGPPLRK